VTRNCSPAYCWRGSSGGWSRKESSTSPVSATWRWPASWTESRAPARCTCGGWPAASCGAPASPSPPAEPSQESPARTGGEPRRVPPTAHDCARAAAAGQAQAQAEGMRTVRAGRCPAAGPGTLPRSQPLPRLDVRQVQRAAPQRRPDKSTAEASASHRPDHAPKPRKPGVSRQPPARR
jgi:hypothetical protein